MNNNTKLLGSAATLSLLLGASPALAAGTAAGLSVTNTVTVNYQVGGVSQTAQTASDTFTVDRKVNVTVAEVGTTTTTVSPGQAAAVTTFQVTNLSNATLDFALAVAQQTGGAGAHGNTDSFDATNVRIYVDTDSSGTFNAGDILVTYLDELAADASKTVFVVSDIPLGQTTGAVAAVTLTATGRESGTAAAQGAALTETTTGNTGGMDTVFADGAGASDATRDAAYSAKDDYTVSAAALTITKRSTLVSDPLNGTTNPKYIPGAVIEYCITVANAAGNASATNVGISDALPSEVTYLSSFGIKVDGTVNGSNVCLADGAVAGSFAGTTVSGTIPTVAASATRTVLFRATIN
ncbi:hypothetical protein [Novosphingobium sp. Gsoil 351]|uniref:hypothetical protein n=1 Tax=Novosphingobium sp. Gsoil 351 TaxID=2675225 RepID=UPI0012B44C41|nr:hypothetical protein [Novosphingobium sp. Gsoil 351]QGN56169.1 hypothetical protein GKE62_18065 [Novosphingobium sp. Gsoil 351]